VILKLVEHLNGHRMLLVLDNFEHVLEASAQVSEVINRTENSLSHHVKGQDFQKKLA
jgi:predicted ATPase